MLAVRHNIIGGAALLAAVLLAYRNALDGAFQFDDYNVIVNYPVVHSWESWVGSMPGIRPLLKLSYTFNWLIDPAPFGFHLLNIVCHLANTAMVLALASRFQKAFYREVDSPCFPWVVAALFALHPAQTEAVTYISGRSVSLMACFYLGAMLVYLRGMERGNGLLSYIASPLLFAVALAVKETAVTLPLALLLWETARRPHAWRSVLAQLVPHGVVLALAAAALLMLEKYQQLFALSLATRHPWENLVVQADAIFYLVVHPLLLLQTNIDPDLRAVETVTGVLVVEAILLAAALLWALLSLQRRSWLALCLLWFFLHIAPTNSLLARLDMVNDRQLYLASIGFFLAASATLFRMSGPRWSIVAAAVMAVILAFATIVRNEEYKTEVTLWAATVERSPHKTRAWTNLGYAYHISGNKKAASKAYARALALEPENLQALANRRALKESLKNPQ